MRHIHTFLVRIVADDDPLAILHGQISEPASPDAWRVTFTDLPGLWALLSTRFIAGQTRSPEAPQQSLPAGPEKTKGGNHA
jgi:hypothetical protein